MDVRNKTVVVTGAGRGIGRATSLQLAERGANVALFDLNASDLEETAALCAANSVQARSYRVNVANEGEVTAAMTRVAKDFGRLDGLVNNAGIVRDGLLVILLASLNKSRPSVAAHALGIATAAFKDMVAYMNERRQSGRRIIDFQGNQFTLADLATDLVMADSWLDYVGGLVDDSATDFGLEASMAKMRAADLAMRMTTEAVQMHGGYGYCRDYRVERLMRDAKITQIWEGTNQIHRQLIGRSFASR